MTDAGSFDQTTLQVRDAVAGDHQALATLVSRFTPFLLAQARYRLGAAAAYCEPEDIVQETWAVTLPRLAGLRAREGRLTPVLMKFLATTLLRCVTQVLRKHVLRRPGSLGQGHGDDDSDPLQQLPAETSGVVTRLCRQGDVDTLRAAIVALPEDERVVLVLRGVEQHSNGEVAEMLGVDDSTVTRRFQQALKRLRAALPDCLAAELE